jgi:hypothetical protein
MLLTEAELKAADRRRRDFDQLQEEISGFTGGRISRFLRQDDIERIRDDRGMGASGSQADFWQRYMEATADVTRQLARTDRAIERALEKSQARVHAAQEALQDIRARATVAEDGRLVYRTQDQQHAYADNGDELSANEMAKVEWRAGAPTWEERVAYGKRLAEATAEHESIQAAKDRADYYHDRLQSGETLSMDELQGIQTDLNAMPKAVRAELEQDHSLPPVHPDDRAGTLDLLAGFTLAASEIAAIRATVTVAETTQPAPIAPHP